MGTGMDTTWRRVHFRIIVWGTEVGHEIDEVQLQAKDELISVGLPKKVSR